MGYKKGQMLPFFLSFKDSTIFQKSKTVSFTVYLKNNFGLIEDNEK